MADEEKPNRGRQDKTTPFPAFLRDKTVPAGGDLDNATRILQHLGPGAPAVAADVRTIDFLRAADEVVGSFGFEIIRLIGAGGMGAVFEGRDRKLDRPVAIKFILPERLEMFEDMLRLLESEARALASISHENAVQVYAIHRKGDNLFIVMELVRGLALAEHVGRYGPLPEAQALRLTIQAARALAALHGEGIIHRDIKPENVLLTADNQAKLSDFGLAIARHGVPSSILSSAAGTPAYMSPEVFEGEKPSFQSDIYSLGMTLRYMLTGNRPDLGNSYEEIRRRVVHGQLPSLRIERKGLSAETELVVSMALKRSKDQRYKTAEAFAAACEKALLQFDAAAAKPKPPPVRGVLRGSGRVLAFLALVMLLAGVMGWWARGVAMRGKIFLKSAGEASSDAALGLFGMRKDLELASAEILAASPEDRVFRFIGAVSAAGGLDPGRHQFIVQDPTGGVLVDDPDAFGEISDHVKPGDVVDLVGRVRVWKGLRVLRLEEHGKRFGQSRPPKAVPLDASRIGPEWLGFCVSLQGLHWADSQPESADRALAIDGAGNSIELRAGADPSPLADRSPGRFDIVGVLLGAEKPAGLPGQIEGFFVVPLERRPSNER